MIFTVLVPAALVVASGALLFRWRRDEQRRRRSRDYLSRIA